MDHKTYREFFRALANPARFAMVQLLRRGPRHVTQMCEELGFEQSRVSHNLGCLLHCGFVEWRWQGKNKVYSLNPGLRPVLEGIDRHIEQYARQLDACRVLEGEGRPVVVLAARARPQLARASRRRKR